MGWLKTTSTFGSAFSAARISVSRASLGLAVKLLSVSIHSVARALGRLCTPRWKDCVPYGALHSTETGIRRALGTVRSSIGAWIVS